MVGFSCSKLALLSLENLDLKVDLLSSHKVDLKHDL